METTINWQQAIQESESVKERKAIEKARILQEVKDSDFDMLDAVDVGYYASILGVTPNEVRAINMKAQGNNHFDYLRSFENCDSDDIFDFF